jgi:hypothetical protein
MPTKPLFGAAFIIAALLTSACDKKEQPITEAAESIETTEVATVEATESGAAEITEDASTESLKLVLVSEQSITSVKEVTAINHESREVTLQDEDGTTETITVGDRVKNLDQVSTGDIVAINYEQNVTVEVIEGPAVTPSATEVVAEVSAEEGEMPAGGITDTTVITATIEAINLENNTYQLKGPDGIVNEFIAQNPDNLKKVSVGDNVIFTLNETIAVAVTKHDASSSTEVSENTEETNSDS